MQLQMVLEELHTKMFIPQKKKKKMGSEVTKLNLDNIKIYNLEYVERQNSTRTIFLPGNRFSSR